MTDDELGSRRGREEGPMSDDHDAQNQGGEAPPHGPLRSDLYLEVREEWERAAAAWASERRDVIRALLDRLDAHAATGEAVPAEELLAVLAEIHRLLRGSEQPSSELPADGTKEARAVPDEGSTRIDDEELDRLEALARAATPGPWATDADDRLLDAAGHDLLQGFFDVETLREGGALRRPEDAAFIAAADPSTVLRLVREIRRLKDLLVLSGETARRRRERIHELIGEPLPPDALREARKEAAIAAMQRLGLWDEQAALDRAVEEVMQERRAEATGIRPGRPEDAAGDVPESLEEQPGPVPANEATPETDAPPLPDGTPETPDEPDAGEP